MRRGRIVAVGALALAAGLLSLFFDGPRGLAGMAAGLGATALSLYGWWPVIGLLSETAVESDSGPRHARATRMATGYVVFIFLLKLPIFIGLALFARWLGGAAVGCFLTGMGLVYSFLIGWGRFHGARAA